MASVKIYAPINVKAKQTSVGTMWKMSADVAKLIAWLETHKNSKGWVNLDMGDRKEVGRYGETHNVWLDTWEPKQEPQQSQQPPQAASDDV